MSNKIPTDLAAIDEELAVLLQETPETTNRGRLLHLINAKVALSGGGGLPTTEAVTDGLTMLNYRETVSGEPNFYTVAPTRVHRVQQDKWSDALKTQSYVHEVGNNLRLGSISALIEGTELKVDLRYTDRNGTVDELLSIAVPDGHTHVWVSSPTFTRLSRGNTIMTGKIVSGEELEICIFMIADDNTLINRGTTSLATNTGSNVDSLLVNVVPYGGTEVVVGVYCNATNQKELTVVALDFAAGLSQRMLINRKADVDVYYSMNLTVLNTDISSGYIAVSDDTPDGNVTVFRDTGAGGFVALSGFVTSGSFSNADSISSAEASNMNNTVYFGSTRGLFGSETSITTYMLDTSSGDITAIPVHFTQAMADHYDISRYMITTVKYQEDNNATDMMIALPVAGRDSGYDLFSIYPDGTPVFSGYRAGDTSYRYVRPIIGYGGVNAIVPFFSKTTGKDIYLAEYPEYADRTITNLDSLRTAGSIEVYQTFNTNENILGAKGVYDPNPLAQVPYENFYNVLYLSDKDAVLEMKPDLVIVVPKSAPVGTQWTVRFNDSESRKTSETDINLLTYVVAEPTSFDAAAKQPAFNPVDIIGGDLSTVVHIVKTGDGEAKLVYL
ncbi:hypothetical protein [Vibrio phage CAU_VPP01]|nr:hypothetical protein [Vibrio phage CAU_VPP01]